MSTTPPPTLTSLLAMDPRARDAAVAERVMGWRHGEPGVNAGLWVDADGVEMGWNCGSYAWCPSTDVTEDYAVLERVRTTFDGARMARFERAMVALWGTRTRFVGNWPIPAFGLYMPGDYALAALLSLDA